MSIPGIDPAEVGVTGLIWLLISYGYVLYLASNLISEGSDLLLLVPSLAGLVGGVVLPLLGAVPDGAIMLFSGLGDVEAAQETLAVGVGALAGSTIMLLTVPWGLSVWKGRVDFSGPDGAPNYKGSPRLRERGPGEGGCAALTDTGVVLTDETHHGSKMMMVTTLPYFLIQVPAFFIVGDREEVSEKEKYWALAGFILCMVFFVAYMYSQVKMSNDAAHKMRRMAVIKESLKKGKVSLSGALASQVQRMEQKKKGEDTPLVDGMLSGASAEVTAHLKGILGDAFRSYDRSNDGVLSRKEFGAFLTDFHESITPEHLEAVFSQFDKDHNNSIDYDEFIAACYVIITSAGAPEPTNQAPNGVQRPTFMGRTASVMASGMLDDKGGDQEEQEEVPEDLTDLSPEEQQRVIKRRAFLMLLLGTGLVIVFSDPMVEVLSEVADRAGIPAFYVSFVLAPLASNASEVIASQYYAAKKTRKTITVALTALEGAASMNNTLCLSIFMALIFFRGLAWQYSAETLSIILVQLVVGVWALRGKMSTLAAMGVLSLFPLSVLFVAMLEYFGLD